MNSTSLYTGEEGRTVNFDSVYELSSSFDLTVFFLRDLQSDTTEFFEPIQILNILRAYFPSKYNDIYQLIGNGHKVKLIPNKSRVSIRKRVYNPVTTFMQRFMSTSTLEDQDMDDVDVYYYGADNEYV